jgi:mono/diheme cytochrome c family protein
MPSRPVAPLCFSLFALAASGVPLAGAEEPSKLFAKSCAPCHGKTGQPSRVFMKQGVRDFGDPAWQKAATDVQLEKTIEEGRKGTMMAAYGGRLSPEETKGLVAYIRTLGSKK